MFKDNDYPVSEHYIIFALLMMSAGIVGAYTFNLRGGVFCNAQTANIVLMAIEFGKGEWMQGLYFLIPFGAYILGAIIAELLNLSLKDIGIFKWTTYFIAIEMVTILVIGFLPLTLPDQIVQVMINFIASMQFTSFKRAEGIPMATTFCTNHIRQVGIAIATAVHERKLAPLKRGLRHFLMIASFFVGGLTLTLLAKPLEEKSIWLSLIPLAIVLILLIYGDIAEHRRMRAKSDTAIENDVVAETK